MVATPTAVLAGYLAGVATAPILWTVYSALMAMQDAVQQDVEEADDT